MWLYGMMQHLMEFFFFVAGGINIFPKKYDDDKLWYHVWTFMLYFGGVVSGNYLSQ